VFGESVFEYQSLDPILEGLNATLLSAGAFSEGISFDLTVTIKGMTESPEVVIPPNEIGSLAEAQWSQMPLGFNIEDMLALKTSTTTWPASVDQNIPEASTFMLVGLGVIGLIGIKMWKKKS
jgi:hypothetical protein